MEIQAALYGMNHFQFLADNANAEQDIAKIIGVLKEEGMELQSQKNAGKPNSELGFTHGKTWGGSLTISPDRGRDGIDSRIVIAMLPYASALIRPLYVVGHFVGDNITDKLLQTYSFPEIVTINAQALHEFQTKFPAPAAKYGVRAQSESEVNQSKGLLLRAVPELRY